MRRPAAARVSERPTIRPDLLRSAPPGVRHGDADRLGVVVPTVSLPRSATASTGPGDRFVRRIPQSSRSDSEGGWLNSGGDRRWRGQAVTDGTRRAPPPTGNDVESPAPRDR